MTDQPEAPRRFVAIPTEKLEETAIAIASAKMACLVLTSAFLWTIAGWSPWILTAASLLTLATAVGIAPYAVLLSRHERGCPTGLLGCCLLAVLLSPATAILTLLANSETS